MLYRVVEVETQREAAVIRNQLVENLRIRSPEKLQQVEETVNMLLQTKKHQNDIKQRVEQTLEEWHRLQAYSLQAQRRKKTRPRRRLAARGTKVRRSR